MEENKVIRDKKDKTLIVIIVCLAVILIALFVFFMIERNENKAHIAAIHQEKEMLQQELTELSHNYDDLKTNNDTLNAKLLGEQEKIANLLDQMKEFRDNSYAEINRYKREIGTLKDVLRSYVVQIDSLNQLNQRLAQENSEVRKQMSWVRERNEKLETQQKDMKEVIARASALRTENFVVYPVNKKDKETNWKKCFNLKAEFVITKNITTERGQRTIYLRLKRPDDKVIAFSDKSFFKYENVSLTYSAKREITYEGERDGVFRLSGYMDGSEDVVRSTDVNVEESKKSSYVDAYLNGRSMEGAMDSADFADFLAYSSLVARKGAAEMSAGNAEPSPAEGACDYCPLAGSCGFAVGVDGDFRARPKINCSGIAKIVRRERGDEE